jgi:nitroimidazol reductase NimA-like FMN-containing flavoprotein (pyridoxamine 5'-phosphate oxidase superfamily)
MNEQVTKQVTPAGSIPITDRTKVNRLPQRGNYEQETIYKILDEGMICHVGFVVNEQPFVIPTGYARYGDKLLIHGSAISRMLKSLREGIRVCVTVTLLDGLVLARSAFHHSMNYRAVVIFGTADVIANADEKMAALTAFTEHIVPGRWDDVRIPTANELLATMVLTIDLTEASAKIRTGPPKDDPEDYSLPVWAGVLPLNQAFGEPIADEALSAGIPAPSYLIGYKR